MGRVVWLRGSGAQTSFPEALVSMYNPLNMIGIAHAERGFQRIEGRWRGTESGRGVGWTDEDVRARRTPVMINGTMTVGSLCSRFEGTSWTAV